MGTTGLGSISSNQGVICCSMFMKNCTEKFLKNENSHTMSTQVHTSKKQCLGQILRNLPSVMIRYNFSGFIAISCLLSQSHYLTCEAGTRTWHFNRGKSLIYIISSKLSGFSEEKNKGCHEQFGNEYQIQNSPCVFNGMLIYILITS